MLLTLTVLDPRAAAQPQRHVTIEAAAGTSFGAVRARVGAVTGLPAAELRVGGRLVDDDDLLGHPPLLRGALLVAGPADRAGGSTGGTGAVELRVVSGSGAGRVVVLGRGQHVIGRAASAGVRLDDPGVSRAHAVLSVSTDGLYLRDLQPTNPSHVDGVALPVEGASVAAGQHLRMGSMTVVVGQADVRPGHHEIVGGEVRIHRQPRIREAATSPPVVFPEAPGRPEHGRVPLLASLAPLALSGILAVVLSSPALLLFALMSPVLLLGQWWSDRRAGRTSYRHQLREHASELERARRDLRESTHRDALRRRCEQPDLAYVEAVVRRRGTRLWERRPADGDHLRVRVGTATQPAEVHTTGPAGERPQVEDLPALLDLQGVVGVAGPHVHASSLAGALLLQVAAWHSPRAVSLHILADTEERARQWEWAAHLPHARGGEDEAARISGGAPGVASHAAALRTLVESRRSTSNGHRPPGARTPVDTLVLVDGASALRAVPGFSELLREGPDAGVALVCLDRDVASLPVEASATLEIEGSGLDGTIREEDHTIVGVVPDLPSPGWLESVSRAMSPYIDATPEIGAGAL
ncbi:MAG TPA: FHA domain-containing protein, partial [Terrabacter sp.]|nr:FHA domain-containing protein [Terrabacter sp.]